MDTPDKRGSGYVFYFVFGSKRHYVHHCYHPYSRSEKDYFQDEFKNTKPLIFDGELKKLKDAESWLLGMKKFFEMHDYT